MGVIDNFKKIIDYRKKRALEGKIKREVVKQNIVETNFYEKYSSFVHGLRDKLDTLLVRGGNTVVVFKPNTPNHAKYFERVIEDTQFNSLFNIKRTSGGEYMFEQKKLIIEDEYEDLI